MWAVDESGGVKGVGRTGRRGLGGSRDGLQREAQVRLRVHMGGSPLPSGGCDRHREGIGARQAGAMRRQAARMTSTRASSMGPWLATSRPVRTRLGEKVVETRGSYGFTFARQAPVDVDVHGGRARVAARRVVARRASRHRKYFEGVLERFVVDALGFLIYLWPCRFREQQI